MSKPQCDYQWVEKGQIITCPNPATRALYDEDGHLCNVCDDVKIEVGDYYPGFDYRIVRIERIDNEVNRG